MQRVMRDTITSMGSIAALDAKISLVRRHLPPNIACLYALPREGSGSVIEWWTELGGQPILSTDLNPDQKRLLLDNWNQHQHSIAHLTDELQRKGDTQAADDLRSLMGEPEPQQLYSLNGTPLVVRWDNLRPRSVAPVIPPAAPSIASAPLRRRWWPWLLLALLTLLVLLATWWWLWRPQAMLPEAVVPPHAAAQLPPVELAPEPEPEPAPQAVPEPLPATEREPQTAPPVAVAKPEKVCPKPAPNELPPQFVVVLDTSGSMDLNINTPRNEDEWYGRVGALLDPSDPRVTRLMTKPSRLDVAKQSLKRMVANLQPEIDTRFMAFQGCTNVGDYGLFPKSRRGALIDGINGLRAAGGTPLAASLSQAASRVDGRNRDAVVVMFIDGEDNCQQDACAVSREIALNQPRLKVNVVNIGQNALSNCMAENTGGRIYVSSDAAKLRDMLQQASKEVSKVPGCP